MSSCSIDAAESEVGITGAAEEAEDEFDGKAAAEAVKVTDGWHIFGRDSPRAKSCSCVRSSSCTRSSWSVSTTLPSGTAARRIGPPFLAARWAIYYPTRR